MTIEEFNQQWGTQWHVLKKHPMFQDAMRVADHVSPAANAHLLTLETISEHTPAFTGRIAGYALFKVLFADQLGAESLDPEEEGTFERTLEEVISEQPTK